MSDNLDNMDINEIAALRKGGDIDGAYKATRTLIDNYPSDPHSLAAHAVSVRALMERAAKQGNTSEMIAFLEEYRNLAPDRTGDPEAINRISWSIRAWMLAKRRSADVSVPELKMVIDAIKPLTFIKPHRYYSILLDAIIQLRNSKNEETAPLMCDFLEWWDLTNLLPEDFKRQRLTNGQLLPSLAERAFSTYYQALKDEVAKGRRLQETEHFIETLDSLLAEKKGFQHTLYHRTRLLKELGREGEALESAVAFVRQRPSDFWSWTMLGDILDDPESKLASYCRALSCRADARFLGRVKAKAAAIMASIGDYPEARQEIEDITRLYNSRNWRLGPDVVEMMHQPWYAETYATGNNQNYYHRFSPKAEGLLYLSIPETPIMITSVNAQKQVAGFVTDDRRRGFFSTKKLGAPVSEYQIYRVRVEGDIPENAPTVMVTCERETNAARYEGIFYRRESGELKWRPGQAFGFVGTTFVDGRLLGDWAETGMAVDLTAAIYWHLKSQQFAWKAVTIRPSQG